MTNKRYPDEFKIEAVRQSTDRGHSVTDVSKRLEVSTHSLGQYVSSIDFESLKCFVCRVRCGLTAGRACPTRQIKKAPCWVPFFIWWSWRDLNSSNYL
ncbi:MAG: transposase [Idiomarina sp.]|nr:transposase [Idiomarina sp.]